MNSRERMQAVLRAEDVDRYPFVPSIYEHGARLLNRGPGETSRSAELMAAAALKARECYQHDLVTVGIDIYNIEAEAFGCEISRVGGKSIPGVLSHPLADQEELDPAVLNIPEPNSANRLQMIVDACRQVVEQIGNEVWVYGCMSGPFSQAVELRGFEQLIIDMLDEPDQVHALMEKTTELSLQQARRLSELGCAVNIFESWGTLPLITPAIFGDYVVPAAKHIIQMIKSEFETPPPAVIMGGDTARLMDHFIEAGTSLVVADFNTDFAFMKEKTKGREMIVRGCADPKMIERGDWEGVKNAVDRLAEKAAGMKNFVWGCGAVSYDTTPEALLKFKEICLAAKV